VLNAAAAAAAAVQRRLMCLAACVPLMAGQH
jgi:hypothetical protein